MIVLRRLISSIRVIRNDDKVQFNLIFSILFLVSFSYAMYWMMFKDWLHYGFFKLSVVIVVSMIILIALMYNNGINIFE